MIPPIDTMEHSGLPSHLNDFAVACTLYPSTQSCSRGKDSGHLHSDAVPRAVTFCWRIPSPWGTSQHAEGQDLSDGCPQKHRRAHALGYFPSDVALEDPCPALAFCSELPGWFSPVVLAAGGFPPRLTDQNEGWLCPQPGVSNSWSQSSPEVSNTLLVSLTFVYAASAGSKFKRGERARSLRSDMRGS